MSCKFNNNDLKFLSTYEIYIDYSAQQTKQDFHFNSITLISSLITSFLTIFAAISFALIRANWKSAYDLTLINFATTKLVIWIIITLKLNWNSKQKTCVDNWRIIESYSFSFMQSLESFSFYLSLSETNSDSHNVAGAIINKTISFFPRSLSLTPRIKFLYFSSPWN
jgi:hypothetical protein